MEKMTIEEFDVFLKEIELYGEYARVMKKVEQEVNKSFDEEEYTFEYFKNSLEEYQKQYDNEMTDLTYLEWLYDEITDYLIFTK